MNEICTVAYGSGIDRTQESFRVRLRIRDADNLDRSIDMTFNMNLFKQHSILRQTSSVSILCLISSNRRERVEERLVH